LNLHHVVVARYATEAAAMAAADQLNADNPWVPYDTPRGRRMTEMLARRGGKQFVVVDPATLATWAMVEFSR